MRRTLAALVLALLLGPALASCALLDGAGAQIGKAVHRYCDEPLAKRENIRAEINRLAAPDQVRVTCAGDPATRNKDPLAGPQGAARS